MEILSRPFMRLCNRLRKSAVILLAMLVIVVNVQETQAQLPSREYQLKAGFIYNFIQFVEWPEAVFQDSKTPFVIGILGPNPYGTYLDQMVAGETKGNHPLEVRHFKNVSDIEDCQILFINLESSDQRKQALSGLRNQSILTVGDAADFSRDNGVIRLRSENGKIRIDINLRAAVDAKLKISSKLLKVADIVQ